MILYDRSSENIKNPSVERKGSLQVYIFLKPRFKNVEISIKKTVISNNQIFYVPKINKNYSWAGAMNYLYSSIHISL